MKKHLLAATTLFLAALTTAHADVHLDMPTVLYVGDSPFCHYDSLQAAISDAAPNNEIRVTSEFGTLTENLSITKNLTIKGGYTSCRDAHRDKRRLLSITSVDGQNSGNVITIDGDGLVVDISGFTLTGGRDEGIGPDRAHGGAISLRGDDNVLTLQRIIMTDNHGRLGGGLYVSGESNTLDLIDVHVNQNSALSGGGIYCHSNGALNNILFAYIDVHDNDADGMIEPYGRGGGLFLDRCDLSVSSTASELGHDSLSWIYYNHAQGLGGGIYANDATLVLSGGVSLNDAQDHGGGIYANNSHLTFGHTRVGGNSTHSNGAGLYLESSTFNVDLDRYTSCKQTDFLCMHFMKNLALGDGGLMYLNNSALLDSTAMPGSMDHFPGFFRYSLSNDGSVAALTNGSFLSIQNAYVFRSGFASNPSASPLGGSVNYQSLFWADGEDTALQVSFSTFIDNDHEYLFNVENDASVSLVNSFINSEIEGADPGFVDLTNPLGPIETNCNVYDDELNLTVLPDDASVVVADTGLVYLPVSRTYGLAPDSVAIDLCRDSGLETIHPDWYLNPRGHDVPGVNDDVGLYDAGAFEYQPSE